MNEGYRVFSSEHVCNFITARSLVAMSCQQGRSTVRYRKRVAVSEWFAVDAAIGLHMLRIPIEGAVR